MGRKSGSGLLAVGGHSHPDQAVTEPAGYGNVLEGSDGVAELGGSGGTGVDHGAQVLVDEKDDLLDDRMHGSTSFLKIFR